MRNVLAAVFEKKFVCGFCGYSSYTISVSVPENAENRENYGRSAFQAGGNALIEDETEQGPAVFSYGAKGLKSGFRR